MIVNFKLSETMEVKVALQNRLKGLKEFSEAGAQLDEMIENTEKALEKIKKAEEDEAKEIMRSEG